MPQHRQAAFVKSRPFEVSLDGGQQLVVLEQSAQTAPVMSDSVVTSVDRADYQRDHLAVHFA